MKRLILAALWAAFIVGGVGTAYGIHRADNAPYVAPTWQQGMVTIDNARMAALAPAWGEAVHLVQARPGTRANITVEYVELERILGDADVIEDGDRIVACHVRLDTKADDATVLHELGHCLGLVGHSAPGRLMAAFGDPSITTPTAGDLADLAHLYKEN